MMEWRDDPELWQTLDNLLTNSEDDLKDFLDTLHQHSPSLEKPLKAILFGGLGQFSVAYNEARTELNEPSMSFALALEKVIQNPQFSVFMLSMMNTTFDANLEKLA